MGYKKNLTILFIILCIALCFIAFGKKKPSKKTFTFWTIQLKAPFGDVIQKNIDIFKKQNPDIEIVWVDIPITEAQKRAIASILGGNPPDLINLNPEFSSLLAQKNSLEYFTEEDIEPYNKNLTEELKYQGKIFALPFYATSPVTILNKEKFKNCGKYPKTYDDILKLSTCENPPVFGIALNEGDSFTKILTKYNIAPDNLDPEQIKKVYELFYEMKNKNLLLKDTLTINHREGIEKYMAGSAAFISAGSNFINMIKENSPSVYENSIVLPQLTGKTNQYDVSIMNFVIPKGAKNKELAKSFASLLLNEENQMLLAKKTNVLPVNNKTLKDPYFKICKQNLTDASRCTAVKQLNSIQKSNFGTKNKKEINDVVNKALETLFLNGEKSFNQDEVSNSIKILTEEN